jgi:hypothetical protein
MTVSIWLGKIKNHQTIDPVGIVSVLDSRERPQTWHLACNHLFIIYLTIRMTESPGMLLTFFD